MIFSLREEPPASRRSLLTVIVKRDALRRIRIAAAAALVAGLGVFPSADASDPSSHDVAAPTHAGGTVRVEWTGVIPPGANTSSSCVDALAADSHEINMSIADGLFAHFIVRAEFKISWSGPTDGIITVEPPKGSPVSSDTGSVDADESVKLINP